MKSIVIRYGLYSALCLCVLALAGWFLGRGLDHTVQEVIGYTSMVVSLAFVFFGIKHYRDRVNEGIVSFGKALVIGLLISAIAALAFGILDVIYVKFINPDFMEEYYTRALQDLQASLPADEYEIQKAKMESQKAMFMNPFMSFLLMAVTVFVIGFIISLLSSLILQRKHKIQQA